MIEFLSDLGVHLRAPDLLCLLVCQEFEKRFCYLTDIARATGQSEMSARRCLRKLEKNRHLVYIVHNWGTSDPNYEILWVRRGLHEPAPEPQRLIRAAKAVRVWHPDHGTKTIQNIREFVRTHNLNYRAFRSVLSGTRSHHHGWQLAPRRGDKRCP